jgi:hypothetical protein
MRSRVIALLLITLAGGAGAFAWEGADPPPSDIEKRIVELEKRLDAAALEREAILKKVDDLLWYQRVGDVADVDKVYLAGPPNPKERRRMESRTSATPSGSGPTCSSPRRRTGRSGCP